MWDRLRIVCLALFWVCFAAEAASAQSNRLLPLDHWSYEYIQRLQRRGHLLDLHPTALPYTRGDVQASVRALRRSDLSRQERAWARRLAEEFGERRRRRDRGVVAGAVLQPGVRVSSHSRLDPVRVLETDETTLDPAGVALYPNAAGKLFIEAGPVVIQTGLRFDLYYRDDPDGLDAANRLIVRNDDSYAGFGSRYFSAYLGRFEHQWARPGTDALLVSNNAVSFDQLHLRVGGERLALRSILGELDSMTADGRYTGTAGADSVAGSVRRFVSAHRFDWRPSRYFSLSLMESTIYSSETSGLSLKFLNPLIWHAFAVDGRPKNDENNGLLAGLLWFQYEGLSIQGQLMLDDFDLVGETGEPPSLALNGHLVYAGWPSVDAGGSLTAVTARAYNTHQPEGRYIHLLRGLGTQFSDYVELSGFASFYRTLGSVDLALTPKLNVLWQGERDIRQPYPTEEDDIGAILTGDSYRTIRPGLAARLQGGPLWWITIDAGPVFSTRSNLDTQLTVLAALTLRLDLVDRIDLSL